MSRGLPLTWRQLCEFQYQSRVFRTPWNIYSDDYSVAQMYKPALVVLIKKSSWERYEAGSLTNNTMTDSLIEETVACSNITLEVYRETMLGNSYDGVVCRIFYFSPLSFPGKVWAVCYINKVDINLIIINALMSGLLVYNTDVITTPRYMIKWKHFLRYWPFVRGIHR